MEKLDGLANNQDLQTEQLSFRFSNPHHEKSIYYNGQGLIVKVNRATSRKYQFKIDIFAGSSIRNRSAY